MNREHLQQIINDILMISMFKYTQHNSIHSLYEILALVLNVARTKLLDYIGLVLVFVNQLGQRKTSSKSNKLANVVDHVSALYTILKQRYLRNNFVWLMVLSIR